MSTSAPDERSGYERAENAGEFFATMDIAFAQNPRENWYRYTRDQRNEWWTMDNAASKIDLALRSLDRPMR